jgi:hypothetical protein
MAKTIHDGSWITSKPECKREEQRVLMDLLKWWPTLTAGTARKAHAQRGIGSDLETYEPFEATGSAPSRFCNRERGMASEHSRTNQEGVHRRALRPDTPDLQAPLFGACLSNKRNWLTPAGTIIRSKKQIRRPPEGPLRNRPSRSATILLRILTRFLSCTKEWLLR